MFKFNFNIDENSNNEYSNTKEDDICSSNQEFGYFYTNDLQSMIVYRKTKKNSSFLK